MTDAELAAEYLRREQAQAITIQGQDPAAICAALADELGRDPAGVAAIVILQTVYGAV